MIFSKDVLYLHIPKTGGNSLSKWLKEVLPRPTYYTTLDEDEARDPPGLHRVHGRMHEGLRRAIEVLPEYGLDVGDLPLIIVCMRNPYAMEVSRFFFLQGLDKPERHNQQLARAGDFERFAQESEPSSGDWLERYFLLDGEVPPNLTAVKAENMEEDVKAALATIGIVSDLPMPWLNVSDHEHFSTYYTPLAEEAVFRRYRWAFESGLYERIDAGRLRSTQARTSYRLPLVGPVRQLGSTEGLSPDMRIGSVLRFTVRAEQRLRGLVLEGALPDPAATPVEVRLTSGGSDEVETLVAAGPFAMRVGAELEEGAEAVIEVRCETSADLAPRLLRLRFEPSGEASPAAKLEAGPLAAGGAEDLMPYVAQVVQDGLGALLPAGSTLLVAGGNEPGERELEGRLVRSIDLDDARACIGKLLDGAAPDADALVITAGAIPPLADALPALDERFSRIWSDGRCIVYRTGSAA